MAKLILKSPYIKSTGGASGYLKYIATRERVEIIPDDRPPTRKQEQLITKLVKDFPEVKGLYEYSDYMDKPTKANASAFITLALESNWDALHESDQYIELLLLSCGRTLIRDDLHPLTGCDVLEVTGSTAGAFDVGTF